MLKNNKNILCPNSSIPKIGKYTIISLIGQGSYAKIYKVYKDNCNQYLVLKQMQISDNEEASSQFQTEVQILSTIHSPYVIKYYDNFISPASFNIITEYCENGDLSELLLNYSSQGKKLNELLIWKFFVQISLGLHYLHNKKILHRDIKTKNIFLTKNLDAKIGDLGIAKILFNTSHAHTFIGTPYYLSPELCKDMPYDEKSDVWALGVVLYEMTTLRHPFDAESQLSLYSKIINEKYEEVDGNYSNELKRMIKALLEKDARNRPRMVDIVNLDIFIEKIKKLGMKIEKEEKIELKHIKGIKKVKVSAVEMNYKKYKEKRQIIESTLRENSYKNNKSNKSLMIKVPASNLVKMMINKENLDGEFLKKIKQNSKREKSNEKRKAEHSNMNIIKGKRRSPSMQISNSNIVQKSIPSSHSVKRLNQKLKDLKNEQKNKGIKSKNRHIIKHIKSIPIFQTIDQKIDRKIHNLNDITLTEKYQIDDNKSKDINKKYNRINKEDNNESVYIVKDKKSEEEEMKKDKEYLLEIEKRYNSKVKYYLNEMSQYSKEILDNVLLMYREVEKDNFEGIEEITNKIKNYIKLNLPEKENEFFSSFRNFILYEIKLKNISELSQKSNN